MTIYCIETIDHAGVREVLEVPDIFSDATDEELSEFNLTDDQLEGLADLQTYHPVDLVDEFASRPDLYASVSLSLRADRA
jgi:hypothetical protein